MPQSSFLEYHVNMANEDPSTPQPQTVDVTGLPEPVIQSLRVIVEEFREKHAKVGPTAAPGERRPLKGRFADRALSISKEEIDAAQREAWNGFPREFPDPPKTS